MHAYMCKLVYTCVLKKDIYIHRMYIYTHMYINIYKYMHIPASLAPPPQPV